MTRRNACFDRAPFAPTLRVQDGSELLSAELLRELMDYDPLSGLFTRKSLLVSKGRWTKARVAGRPSKEPYIAVSVMGCSIWAHRLAVLWMTGEWPAGYVDHINGDGRDNRWNNLRVVTMQQNNQARRSDNKNNTSGFRGVYPRRDKWIAKIMVDGKEIYLGTFASPERASCAYVEARNRLHFR